ncbi:MAG: non-canonical purine NTP pyrophosphatase [Candidatus Thalassarchaeaceae archaeon]|jgi:XTP/dITP diphosphohydrolase|nr:non-canonical purine NTP pyrophosphatase [Candidatus Thalassarchaeaceae archaeon]MDP6318201.1 non-canonical purine NTP pyrophosphatase [Candidatus Thalassarchaeaceae archaeon]DAC35749.1 MAG TPA: non-canonical purine NTP pyrophosphatase [Candidatus Poseidoniales archaeon]HIH79985.1 non-canonical purine NTP pyrophosphatase [Candidatus Thalassarchaeaceae archaeon]HJM29935.1 non-canonical purine NTP pyrophosphatase [Candidatus Thalassarchaeaceae archaeon]|tara:strand:+ start:289 stop:882 length:594 start_codon:yes stop_codon:yes gene_type:complete
MRILFATSNKNKITEAAQILGPLGHTVEGLVIDGKRPVFNEPKELGLEAVTESKIEQALTLIEGTEFEGAAVLVEDSGVFTYAFEGWPGANSADVEEKIGLDGVLNRISKSKNKGGEYRAVVILSDGNNNWKTIGVCKGKFSDEKRGENGFGYDPIFIPEEGDGRTFAEMESSAKSSISHRGAAMKALSSALGGPSK